MLGYILMAVMALGIAVLWQVDMGEHCIIASQRVRIRATRQKVYEAVSDLPGYARWHPGLGKIKPRDSKSNVHLGKEYVETANLPHGETYYSLVVSGHTPPSFFSFTTDSLLESVHEYALEIDEPGVTLVTLRVISRRRSCLFHYVMAPPLRFFFGNQLMQTLYNLKLLF